MSDEPRFYVTTVSGYLSHPTTTHQRGGVSAHVLDRAFNCAVVATYRSESISSKYGDREERKVEAVKRAEMHANHLNAVYG